MLPAPLLHVQYFAPHVLHGHSAAVEDGPFTAPLANVTNESRTRRRISPAQLECLEALYAKTTHPNRVLREKAAVDAGMEVKAVTVWLQNKRQAMKKSGDASRPHSATRPAPLRRTMSVPDTRTASATWARTSSLPPHHLRLPRVSLDSLAGRGRKSQDEPVTNTRHVTRTRDDDVDDDSIWDRMPSSPRDPPSSPSNDFRRLEPLGKRHTMEWACARDRARMSRTSLTPCTDAGSPALSRLSTDTEDTLEDDELRTPDASVGYASPLDAKTKQRQTRDSETADILLLFAGQRIQ